MNSARLELRSCCKEYGSAQSVGPRNTMHFCYLFSTPRRLAFAEVVWATHPEPARVGLIVPSCIVVIRPVAMALRTAASETPRCAA